MQAIGYFEIEASLQRCSRIKAEKDLQDTELRASWKERRTNPETEKAGLALSPDTFREL